MDEIGKKFEIKENSLEGGGTAAARVTASAECTVLTAVSAECTVLTAVSAECTVLTAVSAEYTVLKMGLRNGL